MFGRNISSADHLSASHLFAFVLPLLLKTGTIQNQTTPEANTLILLAASMVLVAE